LQNFLAFPRSFFDSFFHFFEPCCSTRRAPSAKLAAAIMVIVGGPPIITIGPMGTHSTVVVGSIIDFAVAFFLGRGGATMPTSWQDSTGRARKACGSPSTTTVALPMKISLSLVGGFMNGPPIGMCGGRA
jgi:hypothetical protein